MNKRILKRVIIGVVCLSMVSPQVAWGELGEGISVQADVETSGLLQVQVPPDLAEIEETYEAPPRLNPRMILHIQNAHGNYEAQVQIKKLLDYLNEKYGFKTLFVEGAVEKLDPEYLKLFPDQARNLELADYLAQKGQLTGVEYYLMEAPAEVEAIGIEQPELYRANYEAFKTVYGARPDIDHFLKGFQARLETFSSRYFSSR